jgi:hypothetical protein
MTLCGSADWCRKRFECIASLATHRDRRSDSKTMVAGGELRVRLESACQRLPHPSFMQLSKATNRLFSLGRSHVPVSRRATRRNTASTYDHLTTH